MFKFLTTILLAIGLVQVAGAKEVYDTNLKLKCSADKQVLGKEAKGFDHEEISIEITKIDWNKDASKPPNWGSMQNIKIQKGEKSQEASLLLSTRQRIAFSYVENSTKELGATFAQIYELDMDVMEIKKTSVSLFNQASNKISSSISYCKKQ
jgi:hypothetical protein